MSLENKFDISTNKSMDIHMAHERGKDKWSSLVPLMLHDPSVLGLFCLVLNAKSVFGFFPVLGFFAKKRNLSTSNWTKRITIQGIAMKLT